MKIWHEVAHPTPQNLYFKIIITEIKMISISEGTGMSHFRDQQIQGVFT